MALPLTLIPALVISAPKVTAGFKCKIQKQKVDYLDKRYTCIKSGKKLVWNKGVVIVKPVLNPTPTATPTPGPIPEPSPTSTTVVEPNEIKSFQDAVDRPRDVSYWAWKKSSDQLKVITQRDQLLS